MKLLLKWAGIAGGGIIGLFVLLLGIGLLLPNSPKSTTVASSQPEVIAASPTSVDVEAVLRRLEAETKFKPQIDIWGQGQGLFMVDSGWESLSQVEKAAVTEYCKTNNLSAIVVGRLVEKTTGNSVMLDRTVWEQ